MSANWLPPLVLLADSKDAASYGVILYSWFKKDFLDSLPKWPNKEVQLKRLPLRMGKEATFWHFLTEGEVEEDREMDFERCKYIRWPRPVMESFLERKPETADRIVWWRNQRRRKEWRYVLALPDFSYLVVVADRGEYVVPWTQYPVLYGHQQRKYQKEYEDYWRDKS